MSDDAKISPAEKITGPEADRPMDMKELQERTAVSGPNDAENPTVFMMSVPILKYATMGDDGEALLIGHMEIFRVRAVRLMAEMRKIMREKTGLVDPKNVKPNGLAKRIFKVFQ